MAPRDRLLAEAARFLTALLGTCPGEVVVTVRSAELQDGYTLRGPPPANAAEAPPPRRASRAGRPGCRRWRRKSCSTPRRAGGCPLEDLAQKLDPQAVEVPRELRVLVTNLHERRVLEYQKGRGSGGRTVSQRGWLTAQGDCPRDSSGPGVMLPFVLFGGGDMERKGQSCQPTP
jgi:hypothetical protein